MARMDTRTKILEAAARHFSAHGYDNTSLADVAREASVSKALILWHFESKARLFEQVLAHTISSYEVESDEDLESLAEPDQLVELVDRYLEFVRENSEAVRLFLGLVLRSDNRPDEFFDQILALHEHFRRLVADTIRRGQERGTISREAEPEVRAGLLMSALHGIFLRGLLGESGGPPAERLVEEIKTSLLGRLRAPARP